MLTFSILNFLLLALTITASVLIQADPGPEKECYGTNSGFGSSGSRMFHYKSLRRRYEGCTVVRGNLELTNLDDESIDYDLSFLESIHTVTGYVIIALNYANVVPLRSLQLIRGDNLFDLNHNYTNYALIVALTAPRNGSYGMQELTMPSLREISRGQIMFHWNPFLCYVNTINWEGIVRQGVAPGLFKDGSFRQDCEPCDGYCSINGVARCWGRGPDNCQHASSMVDCPSGCGSGCYHSNALDGDVGCCHELCAGGCWGPRVHDCEVCKYYRFQGSCYRHCPQMTYPLGQQCISNPFMRVTSS